MRAIVTPRHGGLEVLEYHTDWPDPVPGAGDALIAVGACGLNNTDVNTRTGWYSKSVAAGTGSGGAGGFGGAAEEDAGWGGAPLTFPRIQGADVCGTVVAVGSAAPGELVGRRVLVDPWLRDPADPDDISRAAYVGSEVDGGYAELVVVPATSVYPVESPLSDVELATFATSYGTAANMMRRAALAAGETVLVTGASGGVGGALIQVARATGAIPYGITSAGKADAVLATGAEAVLSRDATGLSGELRRATGLAEVDVVADVVGGAGFGDLLGVLRRGGRYTCAGAIAGPLVELDLRTMYLHDLTLVGATVPPPHAFAELVGMIEAGHLRPIVAATFPLERFRDAQEAFLAKRHVGNVVISVR
jgi:NADPH:quinone reductase-like Zn-dependent oxidoreductase